MILRRVIEHFRKQEWTAIALDFLIVVIGVFVGIQVSNWNAGRLAAREAEAFIVRIEAEVGENGVDLAQVANYYRQTRRHGEAALAALDRPPESLDSQFLIDLYQTTQIAPRRARRDAYDELLASGVVNSVKSVALRQRFANYYINDESFAVVIRNVPPLRERVRTIMPLDAQRAVRAQCAERLDVDERGATVASLPEHCTLDLSADAVSRAVTSIVQSPDLVVDLGRHVSDLDQKVALLELMIRRTDDLSAFIASARR